MYIRNISAVAIGWVFVLISSTSSAFQIIESYDDETPGKFCGTFWAMSWNSTVTTENSATGGKSCKMAISKGSNGWGGGVSFLEHAYALPKGKELWVRWRMFMPTGYDYGVYGEGDTLKFLRLDMRYASQNSTYEIELLREEQGAALGVYVPYWPCNSYSDCWDFYGDASGKPQRGVWETWEMYMKIDDKSVDKGGTGKMIMWKNGQIIDVQTKQNTINEPSHEIVSVRFFTYWNGGAPRTQHLYFDDLVITDERPAAKDSQGNAYIGTGDFVAGTPTATASPNPPNLLQ